MNDINYYSDIVEAVYDYYGPQRASKIVDWLNEHVPDFTVSGPKPGDSNPSGLTYNGGKA